MAESELEFELGVYVSDFAPEPVRKKAREVIRLVPAGHSFYLVISSHLERYPIPKRLLVAGGDGSIGRVLQMLHDQQVIRPVAVLPGGSQNVIQRALVDLGIKSDINTFLENSLDDYPEDQRLRLGMINKRVFVNHVGLGSFEQHLGRFNARLRFLPNGYRTLAATLLALAAAAPNLGRDFLNLYTITPTIGEIRAFPDQGLLSDTLTHVRGIRQVHGSCFRDRTTSNYIWLDGDTRRYSQQEVFITRVPYGIPVVAIT